MASLIDIVRSCRFVDLTHAFDADTPHCRSFDPAETRVLYHYDEGVGTKGHGFLAHEYRHVGQWGTHCDPPAHFVRGLRLLDEIPVVEMVCPLVVIDISTRAEASPDIVLGAADLHDWERRNGPIPKGAFVAMRTGWDGRWPDQARMENRDAAGIAHFPGWGADALELLATGRDVTAIGHDTTDTDSGIVVSAGTAPMEAYWLGRNKWQIELLANLGEVPEAGAAIIASWPKPRGGSGFPARCFAICPGR